MIEARDTRRDQGLLRTAPDMQVWLHASVTVQYYRGSVSHEEGVDEREGIPSGGHLSSLAVTSQPAAADSPQDPHCRSSLLSLTHMKNPRNPTCH
jgi:hypothetical protein